MYFIITLLLVGSRLRYYPEMKHIYDKLTYVLTDWLTAWLAGWLTGWLSACLPACLPACLHACLPDCLPTCQAAHLPACPPTCPPTWLTDWLNDWLTDWLSALPTFLLRNKEKIKIVYKSSVNFFSFIQSWYSSKFGKNLPISLCCSTFRLISFIFGGYQFFCWQNILERVERLLTEPLVRVQGLLMDHLVCVWSDFPITTLLKMGLFTFLNNKLLSNLKNMG